MNGFDLMSLVFRKKQPSSVACAATISILFGLGLQSSPGYAQSPAEDPAAVEQPAFAVASIHPVDSGGFAQRVSIDFEQDRFIALNCTLQLLLEDAYGVDELQIIAAPEWIDSAEYEIEARIDNATLDQLRAMSDDQRKLAHQHMVQALLAERFNLALHRETKDLPIYSLVISKHGSKLHEARPGDNYANGAKEPDGLPMGSHSLGYMFFVGHVYIPGQGASLDQLTKRLTIELGREVIDNTGLTGNYDFNLDFYVPWTRDHGETLSSLGIEADTQNSDPVGGPSLFSAIQDQLGLKLESKKGPVEILVIDHVERPSEN